MKRTFLKFPNKNFLPVVTSRRMRIGLRRTNIAYKSDGGTAEAEVVEEDAPKSEIEAIKRIGKQVENFAASLGAKANQEEITKLQTEITNLATNIKDMEAKNISQAIESINKGNEALQRQIVELQEQALRDKEAGEGGGKKRKLISTKDVEAFIKTTFGEDGKTKTKKDASIEIATNKAAENFATATFFEGGAATDATAFTGRLVDPTLYQRRRKTNIILDYFNIQTINVPTLVFLVKVEDGDDADSLSGDSGGAEWIVCGAEKPKRSFRVTTGTSQAKKVAIFGTVEDCLLQDVPSLERWIREDFMDEMFEEINSGLLSNNPSVNPDAPQGLTHGAVQYTATPGYNNVFTADTTNFIDQLIAVFAAMRYNREEADIAFVSSDVWYRIQHLKDSQLRYQNSNLVYTSTQGQIYIAGVLVVPVDQEDVPSTHFLVVGRDLGFKIYAYGPMVFERGLNEDDFRHDRTSFRGYQRFLTFLPTHREKSVMYDTFANVKAAIEA